MSWLDHYREQANAWRQEAHRWATHGKEGHAAQANEIAQVYDEMAAEEEAKPSLVTREEIVDEV